MYNPLLITDSYKFSHWKQYPPGTQNVFSYFESRGGKYDEIVFFGLQYFLTRYLEGTFFDQWDLDEAAEFSEKHFGNKAIFNYEGWQYILDTYDGRLPVEIRAVNEGAIVPTRNVLMTITNTDTTVPWLVNWFETLLSQIWYPCTVATQSREMKKTIFNYLQATGTPDSIGFKLHDFGYRGSTSPESAGLGAAAHLLNFMGTDTIAGIEVLDKYYKAKSMPGFSIPAAEHSTITSWGKGNEADAYDNMLTQNPSGLVAVVSDSYDIYNACENIWGDTLKDKVMKRDGCLVIRPDSGNPCLVLPRVLGILGNKFGYTTNGKGFKVLDSHVRLIQGDGITADSLGEILFIITNKGWSTDNIAFGSGGGLLQNVNRDTQKFAFKCSAIKTNGTWWPVSKNPVTDPGKQSKAGVLDLIKVDGKYKTVFEHDPASELKVRFKNGVLYNETSLDEIRERVVIND